MKIAKTSIMALAASSILMIGCAGGSPKLSDAAKAKINASTKYKVTSVHVTTNTLNKDDASKASLYPNNKALEGMIKEDITKYLTNNGLACTTKASCLDLGVDMAYTRVFIIGSNSVGVPHFDYTVQVKDNNTTLLTYKQIGQTLDSGFSRNISITTSIGSKKTNVDVERQDLDKISSEIVQDIKNFN